MAHPTPTERINALREEVEVLKALVATVRESLSQHSAQKAGERLAVLENRLTELDKAFEQLKPSKAEAEEMGALKNRLSQLEEQKKLGDTRAFQFIVLFIGGLLTLAINIAILFLKM